MKKIAEALTEVFFNIEHGVVDRYIKIEDTFVEIYLAKEGETTAEAKERLLTGTGTSGNRHSGKADEQCI